MHIKQVCRIRILLARTDSTVGIAWNGTDKRYCFCSNPCIIHLPPIQLRIDYELDGDRVLCMHWRSMPHGYIMLVINNVD